MKRVLIFGGRGFVGMEMTQEALKRGWAVTCLSRSLPTDKQRIAGAEYDTVDALDAEAVSSKFDSDEIKAVVCSIGSPPLPFVDKQFQIQMNGDTNINIIKAAEAAGIERLVLANATMPKWAPAGYQMGKNLAAAQAQKFHGNGKGALILKLPAVSGTRVDGRFPVPLWIPFAPMRILFGYGESVFGRLEALLPSLFWNVFQPPALTTEISQLSLDFIESEQVDNRFVEAGPFDIFQYQSSMREKAQAN